MSSKWADCNFTHRGPPDSVAWNRNRTAAAIINTRRGRRRVFGASGEPDWGLKKRIRDPCRFLRQGFILRRGAQEFGDRRHIRAAYKSNFLSHTFHSMSDSGRPNLQLRYDLNLLFTFVALRVMEVA